MSKRILLTTTSYQDTPGPHHDLLESTGWEIIRERGPLPEEKMLSLAGDFDAFLCGDDAITKAVIEKSLPRLKVISKYGIGLDRVDVETATAKGLPVTFCPGVNHTTVAEHTFGLMLALFRKIVEENNLVKAGQWKRLTGHELMGKTIGIVGLGRIGKEVATRAKAFGMNVIAYDIYWDEDFAKKHAIERRDSKEEIFREAEILSLHTNLSDETRHMINWETLNTMKKETVILNCARGELVETESMVSALKAGRIWGYGADVLDEEPPPADHPLFSCDNAIITPHIGSRTYESVIRQATMATQNLINVMNGEPALAQANKV
ncbi:MAG: phosphoglycerate dehydrogenase [Opitutales bacterium]|nr:phosphoglycerate dehydrogenase [Opitutales bacterium]